MSRDFEDKSVIEKIKEFAKKELGEKEIFETKIDKRIIGGFILKDKNCQIRASIKDFLYQVKSK